MDLQLAEKLNALQDEGFEIWRRFDVEVRQQEWHPFVPVEYDDVLQKLLELRRPGLKFLEWGSATGVITIMADLLGYDAAGIELDAQLVGIARGLAKKYGSQARFAVGSFLPTGYEWVSPDGDKRLGTIGHGPSGYLALGEPLDEFDIVYAYPWDGEEVVFRDVMRRYGRPDAKLLMPQTF